MRSVVVAWAVLVLLAPEATAQQACRQDGEVTIARNDRAHVVGKRRNGVLHEIYACLGRSSDRIDVEGYPDIDVHRLKLRGFFVAYDAEEAIGEEFSRQLVVRDLRERDGPEPGTAPGRAVDSQDVSVDYPQSPEGPFLGRFGLRPNGSVAFTVWHEGRWRVAMCRYECPKPTVLDGHRGIDPSWLKLSRDRVRWRRRGRAHSAPLR
jgi:hypothetical protein